MSAHHTSPLRPHGEDLLKAALSDPFSVPPDIPRVSPTQPASQSQSLPPPPPSDVPPPSDPSAPASTTTSEPSSSSWSSLPVSPAEQEAHRAEYEANVVEWRRQSADVRTHAEAERARWAERRAREREEQLARGRPDGSRPETGVSASGENVGASASASDWEAVSPVATQQSASVLPPGTSTGTTAPDSDPEPRGRTGAPAHLHSRQGSHTQNLPQSASSNAPPTRPAPTDSPQWENVLSSPTSSFPSMSFPEPSRPHSPEHPLHASQAAATLAVFDSALPPRTRIWALFSSLSINMFLPFVNGVMLGFGEIFAKTVIVGWLGWGPKVATNVGLGVPSRSHS